MSNKMQVSEIRRILERGEWWEYLRDVSPDEPCPWRDELYSAIDAALDKLNEYENAEKGNQSGESVTPPPLKVGQRVRLRHGRYDVIKRSENGGSSGTSKYYPGYPPLWGTVTAVKNEAPYEAYEVRLDCDDYWTLDYVWRDNILERGMDVSRTKKRNPAAVHLPTLRKGRKENET